MKLARFAYALLVHQLAFVSLLAAQQIQVDSGELRGSSRNGVEAFKGIPFAAPPVGDLRWRPPQPVARWTGVRDAVAYGNDCMQLPFPSDAAPLGTTPSEGCLVLNLWTPQHKAAAKLPVMVWIYGGGWVNGGSSPAVYDGTHFAEDGVVFVSFNYRVGRFGFFAHPALTKEDPDGLKGNYGYMDAIAALKWVQRNIQAFGGDPEQVTVFGESAGGFAVNTLLNTPLTIGLFQRAIIESGGGRELGLGRSTYLLKASNGTPSAENVGVVFAKSKGIDGQGSDALAKLRHLPAAEIVDGLNLGSLSHPAAPFTGPIIDGKIFTEPLDTSYAAGRQHSVPVIVGANSMEIGFPQTSNRQDLYASFGEASKEAEDAYDPTHTEDFKIISMRAASDAFMVEPARFVAQMVSSHGQKAWEYRFSYVAESMRKELSGAPHASEIPFVFDTVDDKYTSRLTPSDERTAHTMHQYWVEFAKTGNPNGLGLQRWPAYDVKTDLLMNFTSAGLLAEKDPWKNWLDLTQQLVIRSSPIGEGAGLER